MYNTYPTDLVLPMKAELVEQGFEELLTAQSVEQAMAQKGTLFIVINSVCGCSAGCLRPGVVQALRTAKHRPDHTMTAFAGYDIEAVEKIREYLLPFPPSSPSAALFKDGKLIQFIERHNIEGANAQIVADGLVTLFDKYCA